MSGKTVAGPLRVVQIGAGEMGRAWLQALGRNDDVVLVGLVDLNRQAADALLAEIGLAHVPTATRLSELDVAADFVVNVTVPLAHLPVNVEAFEAGLPVLCEKPAAPTVADALRQAASAEAHGQLLMISQSRRYFDGFRALRRAVAPLGEIGTVAVEFFKAPHFGGFREEMAHVLLVDMSIHHFDAVRSLLESDPVAVYAEEYNPAWSWFRADANAAAVFEFEGGIRFTYTGSWCAPGHETSWNGRWRVSAAGGTALWDGDGAPEVALGDELRGIALEPEPEQIDGSLAEFVACLREGRNPDTDARSNVLSLAMVEAAVLSSASGSRVVISDVLDAAHVQARESEPEAEVRAVLERWHEER